MQQFSRALLAVILHLNMADSPADRRSVQGFVRNVINAVTNLQTRSNQRGNNEESSRAEFESITDEMNAQFQIPRQASRGRRIATATTSTIVSAASFNPRQNYTFLDIMKRNPCALHVFFYRPIARNPPSCQKSFGSQG